jgi:hypothetical protein
MSRRSIVLVAGGAMVVLIGATIVGVGVLGVGTDSASARAAPHFIDETATAGVGHTYGGAYPYSVGGGVAVFDCNADGRPDLYLAGGSGPGVLYRNDSPVGGSLHFDPVVDPVVDQDGVTGAYPIDFDGDGQVDLVVLRNGENLLLRGTGLCHFERANERLGFAGGNAFTTAFSATWEGTRGLPTLAFGNYVANAESPDPNHLCSDNQLVRPGADGTRYASPIPLTPAWCALSILFSDWDRSGRRDLRVSNDRHYYSDFSAGQEQLWRIATGQPPRLYTAADGWVAMRLFGMGIASYDVTGDGFPDVYLTSQADNKLQTLATGPSQPAYRDIALARGVTAAHPFTGGDPLPSTAWHPQFEDVNNDGLMDLFVSKGNVDTEADYASRDPSDLFLGQPDGTFVEGALQAGIVTFDRGRGAALADFNLDGLVDLVQLNLGTPVTVWRNVGAGSAAAGSAAAPAQMGHWLSLRFQQPGPNRDAIGSWVEVRVGAKVQWRELTIGGGHAGGQLGWVHFGIGAAAGADVRVQWPDGEQGPWIHLAADGFATIERGASAAEPWQPPAP